MDTVERITQSIEPMTSFPTVDELNDLVGALASEHPHVVHTRALGRSRAGEEIRVTTVGDGAAKIVVVGNPHPNEPIGLATITHLLKRLCRDHGLRRELDATWHVVACADPDGTRLNESWYRGPFTREHVARRLYRPPLRAQVEWTFPAEWNGRPYGDPMPETVALMRLLDEAQPDLIVSLHNGDFGGGFFYVSGGADNSYYDDLRRLLEEASIPVHRGEADAPGAVKLAPGVFELPSFGRMCDTLAAVGVEPSELLHGGGPRDYSAGYGTGVLVCELPLWSDPRAGDEAALNRPVADVYRAAGERYLAMADALEPPLAAAAAHADPTDPFLAAAQELVPAVRTTGNRSLAAAGMVDARPATAAEAFLEELVWPGVLGLRAGGMMLRLLERQGGEAAGDPAFAARRAEFASTFDHWCADAMRETPGLAIPIAQLVSVQAAAVVLAACRLRDGLPV